MSQVSLRYVLRPGVEIYRASPRDFIIRMGFAPRYSFVLKDDSKDLALARLLEAIEQRGGLDEEMVNRYQDDAFIRELLEKEILIPYQRLSVAHLGGPIIERRLAVGLVGSGLLGYLAIEHLARYQGMVDTLHLYLRPTHVYLESETAGGHLFPYLGGTQFSVEELVTHLWKESRSRLASSLKELIEQSDFIFVSLTSLDLNILLQMDQWAHQMSKPWIFGLSSGYVGLAGPMVVREQTPRFREFLEYARFSGLFSFVEGERYLSPHSLLLGTPYHLATQISALLIHEGMRYMWSGTSSLKGAIYLLDEERGIVGRGKIAHIPGYNEGPLGVSVDPPIIGAVTEAK